MLVLLEKVFFEQNFVCFHFNDDRLVKVPADFCAKLMDLSEEEKSQYTISPDGKVIRWASLSDEFLLEDLVLGLNASLPGETGMKGVSILSFKITKNHFIAELSNCRVLSIPILVFPELILSTHDQLSDFVLSPTGEKVSWEHLAKELYLGDLIALE